MSANRWMLPEGISELLPPEAAAVEKMRRQILDLYASWGCELVEPPLVEYLDSLLTGMGRELDIQTFKLVDQQSDPVRVVIQWKREAQAEFPSMPDTVAEIEAVLHAVPGVHDCAVFGIPDAEFGEALMAVVEPQPGVSLDMSAVRAQLKTALADYKVPKHIEIQTNLPREDSGKIFKRRLRDPYWERAGRRI